MLLKITLLDKYLFKKLLDFAILGLVLFTLVLFFSDALLDFMKDLQHYGIGWDIALTLVCLQIPRLVVEAIPMSALLATLMVYNTLSNQFELISMRVCGISLYRLSRPAVVLGIGACLCSFLLNDFAVPFCNKLSNELKTAAINEQNLPASHDNFMFKQFDANQQLQKLIFVSHFNGKELGYTTMLDLTNPNTLQILQAQSGEWGQKNINLNQANIYTISGNQKLTNTTHADQFEVKNFIQPEITENTYKPRELSFLPLLHWIQNQVSLHQKVAPDLYVSLWKRIWVPLNAVALVLIAVPLAITSPRNIRPLGFLMAVIVLFSYYVLRAVTEQFGKQAIIEPFLAISLPFLILSCLAIILFQRKNVRL